MLSTLIFWAILGLHGEWRPDACDRVFSSDVNKAFCERKRDEGQTWARTLSEIIATEATRQNLQANWDWWVGDIEKESAFYNGDVCPIRIRVDSIISREVLNEETGKEKMCWSYFIHQESPPGQNCQPVLVRSEGEEYIEVDRCGNGETGLFQVMRHEARAGQIVPATGEELPRSPGLRRERLLDPTVNISIGMEVLARVRDTCCCEEAADGTQTCDAECQADPSKYLGAYNTGSCHSEAGERYVGRVQRLATKAREYACQQVPEAVECGGTGVTTTDTPTTDPVATDPVTPTTTPVTP